MKTIYPFVTSIRFLAGTGAVVLMSACGGGSGGGVEAVATDTALSVSFAAESGGTAISCDTTLTGLGLSGTDASLRDFRFYVHDLQLQTDQGRSLALQLEENTWQQQGVALLDFQDRVDCTGDSKQTHERVTGTLALREGESVNGLQFRLGIPQALNHADQAAAQSPLNVQSLFWSWQSGYKFMRLDVAPVGGIVRPTDPAYLGTTFNLHLGSTNCTGNPQAGDDVSCARPNRPEIVFANFDPESDTIVFDYGQLVARLNLGQDSGGAAGCMSGLTDPECAEVFEALGLDLASGEPDPGLVQTAFSLR